MTRSLISLLALAAVFFTSSCVGEGDLNTWRDYEAGGNAEPESDDDDSTPPADDDDLRPDGDVGDDDSEDEDPPRPDDDDATDPPADDDDVSDDDATEPDLPADDDDASDDDDATDPLLPDDDDDSTSEPPVDADSDGYPVGTDCDDSNPAIHPGASEICNGLDDNCNGILPGNDGDADADGILECAGDCDDQDDTVYPGAGEACNDQDDDCDGAVDETFPTQRFYMDADGDGVSDGINYITVSQCATPTPPWMDWNVGPYDCDDSDLTVYPLASELCDGQDNDCDGLVDEGCSSPNLIEVTKDASWCSGESWGLGVWVNAQWLGAWPSITGTYLDVGVGNTLSGTIAIGPGAYFWVQGWCDLVPANAVTWLGEQSPGGWVEHVATIVLGGDLYVVNSTEDDTPAYGACNKRTTSNDLVCRRPL